jgi:opacity protein-like surface antigen
MTASVALLGLCAFASLAAAQGASEETPSLRAHRVTLSGGVLWTGGYEIGDATATLRGNGLGANPPPFTLFESSSSMDGTIGVETRIGFSLTRTLAIEGGFAYQRPGLTTSLSGDAEAVATSIDAEQLAQYVVDVGAVWQVPGVTFGSRIRPFVMAGGGYLRQLFDERTLVETGSVYYGGGGVRYWLRGGDGSGRSMGLRADVRLQWRNGGVDFEDRTRMMPVVAASVFYEF